MIEKRGIINTKITMYHSIFTFLSFRTIRYIYYTTCLQTVILDEPLNERERTKLITSFFWSLTRGGTSLSFSYFLKRFSVGHPFVTNK